MSSLPVATASSAGHTDSAGNGNNTAENNDNGDNNGDRDNHDNNNNDNAIITAADNGRFRLPSVLIQYEDGTSQNLTIEVGPRNSRSRNTINDSLDAFYSALQNSPITPQEYVQDLRNRMESGPLTHQRASSEPLTASVIPEREGVRGLDYPAFDVTREGVLREPSNPVSSSSLPTEEDSSENDGNTNINNNNYNNNNNNNNTNDTNDNENSNTTTNDSNNNTATADSSTPSSSTSSFSSGEFLRHFLLPFQRSLERNRALHNTNAASAATNILSPSTAAPDVNEQHATIPSTSSSSNDITDDTRTSRNIILTVNYIYGQGEITQANALNENNDNNMSGSLILNVPNISGGDSESLQVLIRLATTIALRTIASSVKKSTGISSEAFTTLKTLKLENLRPSEKSCPICYDDYLEIEETKQDEDDDEEEEEEEDDDEEEVVIEQGDSHKTGVSRGKKRRMSSDTKAKPKKKTKLNPSAKPIGSTTETTDATSSSTATDDKKKPVVPSFTHVAVEMPCGHIFGRSCLYEWLKANNSCPLCRDDIKKQKTFQQFANNGQNVSNQAMTERTITLPNLASVISQGRENIDDFSSRNLTFIMTDQDQQEHQLQINGEFNSPLVIAPSGNADNTSNNGGENLTPHIGTLRENLNTLRGLLESVTRGGTTTRLRDGNASALNVNRAIHRLTTPLRSQLPNSNLVRVVNSRRRSSANATRLINRDPLFPIGVESRRVAGGVETREVFSNENSAAQPDSADNTSSSSSSERRGDETHPEEANHDDNA